MRGDQKKKLELLISLSLGEKFLHRAIVLEITYQYTKFQLPSLISSGDMELVLK